MSNQNPCAQCGGRKFVRAPCGWSPCPVCYWDAIASTFIRPQIRQTDATLPAEEWKREPLPWADQVVGGDYQRFRYRVWRSLLHYYDRRPTYEYWEAFRLTEMHFERDPTYKSVRAALDFDLLVLVLGVIDPPNSYTGSLVQHVVGLRHMHGKPTWLYSRQGVLPAGVSAPSLPEGGKEKRPLGNLL